MMSQERVIRNSPQYKAFEDICEVARPLFMELRSS